MPGHVPVNLLYTGSASVDWPSNLGSWAGICGGAGDPYQGGSFQTHPVSVGSPAVRTMSGQPGALQSSWRRGRGTCRSCGRRVRESPGASWTERAKNVKTSGAKWNRRGYDCERTPRCLCRLSQQKVEKVGSTKVQDRSLSQSVGWRAEADEGP